MRRFRPAFAALSLLPSCSIVDVALPERAPVNVAPDRVVDDGSERASIQLASSTATPIYRELLAVDLAIVAQLAVAHHPDLELARARVAAREGQAQAAAGVFVPVLSPGITYETVSGAVRATAGNAVDVSFQTWQPYALAQLLVNPGKACYDLVAARKRLLSAKHSERAAEVEVLRTAARQYYDLILAQAHVDAARQSATETQELRRIVQARVRAGTAVAADDLTAQAEAAHREQDLLLALRGFEKASLELAITLDLDPTITLAPTTEVVSQRTLVRDELSIDELLAIAIEHRDDLHAVRALVDAAGADAKAARWNAWGPSALLGAQFGGIRGSAEDVPGLGDVRYALHEQSRLNAGVGARLSAASFGDVAASDAVAHAAGVEAARALELARAEVVAADRDRRAEQRLLPLTTEELMAAEEALRLASKQLQAGTATTLDLLERQSALSRARVANAEAVVRFNQSQVDLLAALGVLDAQSLAGLGDAPQGRS